MVLVDLYSGPNYIFETITGHSEGTSRALVVLYLALALLQKRHVPTRHTHVIRVPCVLEYTMANASAKRIGSYSYSQSYIDKF